MNGARAATAIVSYVACRKGRPQSGLFSESTRERQAESSLQFLAYGKWFKVNTTKTHSNLFTFVGLSSL